jgi:hypothetical protein
MRATTYIELEDRYDEDTDTVFEVTAEWEFSALIPAQLYGPPENCYPAEGGELESCLVYLPDGTEKDEQWLIDELGQDGYSREEESAFTSAEDEDWRY